MADFVLVEHNRFRYRLGACALAEIAASPPEKCHRQYDHDSDDDRHRRSHQLRRLEVSVGEDCDERRSCAQSDEV